MPRLFCFIISICFSNGIFISSCTSLLVAGERSLLVTGVVRAPRVGGVGCPRERAGVCVVAGGKGCVYTCTEPLVRKPSTASL